MSIILDALKKSENDRQRQNGPAGVDVRVPPPRSKLPTLAIVIVSLLVVNLGVVGWLMLRKPAAAAEASPPAAAAAPAATQAPTQFTAHQNPSQQPPPQGYGQYPQQPGMQPPPNMPQGYNGTPNNGYAYAQNGPNGGYPQNGPNNGYAQNGANNGYPPSGTGYPPPNTYGRAPTQEPVLDQSAAGADGEQTNPDDYAPARDAPPPGTGAGRVIRGDASGLPTYEEAATQTSIPPQHKDLHSYAADPSKRFVLINMRRLYEGQALPEGPKVESINNDSAIMSYNGTKFVLNKD